MLTERQSQIRYGSVKMISRCPALEGLYTIAELLYLK